MTIRRRFAILAVLPITPALVLLGGGSAQAHPLGNFTVNHFHRLQVFPDQVQDLAVVDTAEIPAAQERTRVDTDRDGRTSADERRRYGSATCVTLADKVEITGDGTSLRWVMMDSRFDYRAGAAGLPVSRLECRMRVEARLDRSATLTVRDGYLPDRLGWREITAIGQGVRLVDSPVPTESISQELRRYPNDLLSSPLDVRSATLTVQPGSGASTVRTATDLPVAGPVTRALARLSDKFEAQVGTERLTFTVGLLAVLLALLLGAGHAVLPGHGKTVIAAYLAGRQGSKRDALTVGATVTATHTAGVIGLGLLLSAAATIAGDQILAGLGVAGGLLITGIGGWLLVGALRAAAERRAADRAGADLVVATGVSVPLSVPVPTSPSAAELPAATGSANGLAPDYASGQEHGHGHGHGHGDGNGNGHGDGHGFGHGHGHGHRHGFGHSYGHGHGHDDRVGRGALIGMGIAGGLVPSPSALVVLLAAIGLGRTAFGVLLVVCYGLGMAATLTAVGLLLVHLRGRLDDHLNRRFDGTAARLARIAPLVTAALVLLVGLGLTARGLPPLLT
jgi:ABC-type nickel/cobalt efflux system permease component RcnA